MGHFALKSKVKTNGFEGWYLRLNDPSIGFNMALIFAHTTNEDDPHAFIQLFDGTLKTNTYLRFDADAFRFHNDTVWIAGNELSVSHVHLDTDLLKLDAQFENPVYNAEKSAMGLLEKFPLETFQEVVIMDGVMRGEATLYGVKKNLSGTLYMEKTYGQKFPKTWFWVQANHFDIPGVSLSMSGGHVPTIKFRPFGFFALLYTPEANMRFATYDLSRIHIDHTPELTRFTVRKRFSTLIVDVTRHAPTELVGPTDGGAMTLPVYESITAHVTLTYKRRNKTILSAKSALAGFEYMMKG